MYFIPEGEEEVENGMEVESQSGLVDYLTQLYDYVREGRQKPVIHQLEWEQVIMPEDDPPLPIVVKKKRDITDEVIEETKEELARSKKRVTKPPDRIAIQYVGNKSLSERKALFLTYYGPQSATSLHSSISQNPYEPTSWYTTMDITRINTGFMNVARGGVTKEAFDMRYAVSRLGQREVQSVSMPTVYLVEPKNKSQFREILFGANDLVMKIIPLFNSGGLLPEDELAQIYNEIKAAYFLNELLYGYENVLSVHFMSIVDWFQASRTQIGLPKGRTDHLLHQVVIAERAHRHLDDYLFMHNTLPALRVVLFQILHALETAWHTNQFTHNDMHMGNVMLREVAHEESPFRDKNFIYKRLGRPLWYTLDKQDLHNHIVKLIDFGRSRLYVPASEIHTNMRHMHGNLIGVDYPSIGSPLKEANRQIDLRSLFLTILMLPDEYWKRMGIEESNEVFAFVEDDVLDFVAINRIIDTAPFILEYGAVREERRRFAGGQLRASNLHKCRHCFAYLSHPGVFRYANDGKGENVTNVLDSAFFHSLRILPEGDTERSFGISKIVEDYIVVSFLTGNEDIRMRRPNTLASSIATSSKSNTLRCSVCECDATFVNREKSSGVIVPLCGKQCAQFKYFFASKTALR
jgi:hypothetical protein